MKKLKTPLTISLMVLLLGTGLIFQSKTNYADLLKGKDNPEIELSESSHPSKTKNMKLAKLTYQEASMNMEILRQKQLKSDELHKLEINLIQAKEAFEEGDAGSAFGLSMALKAESYNLMAELES